MKEVNELLNDLLTDFNPKQRRVIESRFGIKNGVRTTLQKIGDELGVTRERVRQIEEQGMEKLRPRVKKEAAPIIKDAKVYLAGTGGIRRDDVFVNELKYLLNVNDSKVKHASHKLRFLLLVADEPRFQHGDDEVHDFWFLNDEAKEKFFKFVKKVTNLLESGDRREALEKKAYLAECRNLSLSHMLTIPKYFGTNVFGDFGLKAWPEIEPRTVRDKAYLALRKYGKPLHFADIAKSINDFGIDKKPAHVQTVHNELIKDNRFVLVGRGMYALREHGFEPGTVREVVAGLLKRRGPLKPGEIIKLVNQQRILKENTILLNLQNRRHFKRLDDGRYHVREA
ncbi:MAG: sigma factor-like helix-turn-helix DNA-binding protein [Candidatus Jorgensenbacteria bacterium]